MNERMICPYSSECPKKPAKTTAQSFGDRCYHAGPHDVSKYCDRICGLALRQRGKCCVHHHELDEELFEI